MNGHRSIWKKLFQRVVMVGLSIVAQLAVFVLMIWRFQDQNEGIYFALMGLSIVATLFIISPEHQPGV